MPSDHYLLIKGVKGESVLKACRLLAVTVHRTRQLFVGASNPADVGGGGLSAGKCSLSDFSFSSPWIRPATRFSRICTPARTIATVTFLSRKSTGAATPFTYINSVMTNCYVTSHGTGGGPLESVAER